MRILRTVLGAKDRCYPRSRIGHTSSPPATSTAAAIRLGAAKLPVRSRIQPAIAGGETAGIPFAAWIAERLDLPMLYVRKQPKGFGRNARIEGEIREGSRVLLVEDLTTDGGSKVSFVEAIREAGAVCGHTIVVFYYDIFPQVPARLAEHGIRLHYLATWRDVLAEARRGDYFEPATMDEVEAFLDHPLEWSAAHGGKSEISI